MEIALGNYILEPKTIEGVRLYADFPFWLFEKKDLKSLGYG